MFQINSRYSTCARTVYGNPFTGSVKVRFKSGSKQYRFTRVSRRQILSAAIVAPISVGEWINRNCLQNHETVTV
jgi:hypothetical protein